MRAHPDVYYHPRRDWLEQAQEWESRACLSGFRLPSQSVSEILEVRHPVAEHIRCSAERLRHPSHRREG